jgi:hypothetical protein
MSINLLQKNKNLQVTKIIEKNNNKFPFIQISKDLFY